MSKARDQYQQRQLEQQVIQEVKLARNQLEMAASQIEAAKIARDLGQKNVEAEQQKALAAHPLVDKISFTGSTEVGRRIMHAAADQIRKVTLELGGKAANIVFPDADLDAAVGFCVLTSCYNSGQVCTSCSRLVLHRGIHDRFLEALTRTMKSLKVGDPMKPDSKLGPVTSREQFDRVNRYISSGKDSYAYTVCGTRDAELNRGYFIDPIVFDHVDGNAAIAQEEIFGPVLSVLDFETEEDALRTANQTQYGLATAIWTSDLARAHRLAAQVDSGFVWINCNNFWLPSIPYEGHRHSGIGVDMGIEAVEGYTKLKNVIVNLDRSGRVCCCDIRCRCLQRAFYLHHGLFGKPRVFRA